MRTVRTVNDNYYHNNNNAIDSFLKVLDQELNVTRRVTRPFVPTDSDDYQQLQRQRDVLDMPLMPIPVQKPQR